MFNLNRDLSSQNVASVLGHNDPEIIIEVTYDDPIFGNQTEEITLPTGLAEDLILTCYQPLLFKQD